MLQVRCVLVLLPKEQQEEKYLKQATILLSLKKK